MVYSLPSDSAPAPATPVSEAPIPERTATQESDNDGWIRRKEAKLNFKKTLHGRYGNGPTGYSKVGVLLIYWEGDNKNFEREAMHLEAVLREQFGFYTERYAIPLFPDTPARSAKELEVRLEEWANEYEGPDKLSIIYYGGHGEKKGHSMNISSKAGAFFKADGLLRPLKAKDTDTLVIVDCCYAAHAFSENRCGKRKFELLSCVPPEEEALGPTHASSFSGGLTRALSALRKEHGLKGFTTSDLYREVYFASPLSKKPFLFDCSSKNFGYIRIIPFAPRSNSPQTTPEPPKSSPIFVDLRFQLSELPNPGIMTELASHMQVQMIKPLLNKIRMKREKTRLSKQKEDGMGISQTQQENSFGPLSRRNSELHDWNNYERPEAAKGELSQTLRLNPVAPNTPDGSRPQEPLVSPTRRRRSPSPLAAISEAETSDSTKARPVKKKRDSHPVALDLDESRLKRPRNE
ncbi:uncharacterized protein J3D65DRAFT_30273 [Phyllosticta citribraziliensis]|uniref:Peptidase C14 caspase domain-containing protein n=1 Tax=Phyllosticta citribraziliensis TaxID=989973 RepID=A0ABR1MBI1_9PEZI